MLEKRKVNPCLYLQFVWLFVGFFPLTMVLLKLFNSEHTWTVQSDLLILSCWCVKH